MTAPMLHKRSPSLVQPEDGIGVFAIDPNFGLNQTIKVAVRMRPLAPDDPDKLKTKKNKNVDKRAWNLQNNSLVQNGTVRKVDGRTVFHFDQIFDEETKTPLLYKSLARPMVQSVLNGKHATIFAYGQTGTGKTFTMQGDGKKQSGQAGIIQLVASDLFRLMVKGEKSQRDFVVKVSYVEVYNERIRDLLSDDVGSTASHATPEGGVVKPSGPEVQIRTSGNGDIVMNCSQEEVQNVDEVLELLVTGNTQRVVAKTDMNNHSSRSHAVFRLTIESREKEDQGAGAEVLRVSDFNLVDLAGSESHKMSNSAGIRIREGAKINQSLLSLSSVIHSLSLPEKKRPSHISYRDSKLTRILQSHLSGNADMAIICCANSSKAYLEETRSTLKFGARAKHVAVKPKVNEVLDDTLLIKKLQHELAEAKRQLEVMKKNPAVTAPIEYSPPEQEQRPPSKTLSIEKSDAKSDGTESSDGEPSVEPDYGYEDMEAHGNRQYVMPADQEVVPPAMERAYMPQSEDAPPAVDRAYVMPKNQDISVDSEEGDFEESTSSQGNNQGNNNQGNSNQGNNRAYVMPKNHENPVNSGMDDYLKNRAANEDEEKSAYNMGSSGNTAAFKLDAVGDPEEAKKTLYRYMNGRDNDAESEGGESESSDEELSGLERISSMESKRKTHEFDFPIPGAAPKEYRMPGHFVDKDSGSPSRHDTTEPTEDESLDGPEGSYAEISLKFGSVVSTPDTLRGVSTLPAEVGSKYGTLESAEDHALDGRVHNKISWDTMDFNTLQPDQVGRPLKAMQSIYNRDAPLPEEITIMRVSIPEDKEDMCLTDKLEDAEARAAFLRARLDLSDDLVEGIFKDLERARLCIHDMVYRNVQLGAKFKEKKREDIKKEYQEGEVVVEQYWLLKGSMYVSLFFFITGGYEFFMAAVFLVWLILEANLSA